MIGKVAYRAVLHHDNQIVLTQETLLVCNYIGVFQVFKQSCLHHAPLLLLLRESLEDHLLCNILLILYLVSHKPS